MQKKTKKARCRKFGYEILFADNGREGVIMDTFTNKGAAEQQARAAKAIGAKVRVVKVCVSPRSRKRVPLYGSR